MNVEKRSQNLISKLGFAYRYVFFRIYRWQLKQFGPVNAPEMVGVAGVGWLIWSNILSFFILLKFITGIELLAPQHAVWIVGGVLALVFGASVYFFVFGRKYYLIAKEFKDENEMDSRRRGRYVWIYTLLSIALLAASMYTANKKPLF